MSLEVEVTVNGEPIRRLLIDNLTERTAGVNTYRWTYVRLDAPMHISLLSAQQGRLEHVMEHGAMALISKVAQAASESETADE
jgi:hypothetical protein